ncbi:Xylose isomerase-like TIM barrel [Novipirellula galeiformis]|uniref:Xylose isomerase-like TIM barrel n=1 Tax=Novipirellula galeiformis TaxID=2528004 RepID=A0A5C6C288_9BACT|nr:TIM barrel protein [Novipirellula galeiformis]TWU17761.1 Xylose isomerase-like TIM barrel [Novipirellula galeiformis]
MSLDRRQFLAHSAVGLAALSAPRLGAAEAAKNPLQLGLVTYNWGKDWDVPTLIKNCEASNFSGVELRSTHKHGVEITLDAKQRDHVRKQFADSNVAVVGLGSACEYHAIDPAVLKKNIEETQQFVKLCKDVGGSGVKVRPNGLPAGRPVEQTLEQIGKSLNEVGRYAADYGVQIRVEVHGRGTSEIHHMKTIMDIADHPNVAVCWNCNPADMNGEGLKHNYNLLKDRMGTVHIHDLRNNKYPWTELFPMLKATDAESFTGWTLVEEGAVPKDLVQAMKENRVRWEELVS